MTRIELEDGKYTVLYDLGECKALRYGEPWRDLTGDKLIGCMLERIEELEARLGGVEYDHINAHNNAIDECVAKVRTLTLGMEQERVKHVLRALWELKK